MIVLGVILVVALLMGAQFTAFELLLILAIGYLADAVRGRVVPLRL
jgi:hypothetical protein